MRRPQTRGRDADATRVTVGAAVVCLTVALGVCLSTAPVAAHQFVSFDRAPLAGTAGETVAVPVNLHRVDRVTVGVTGPGGGVTAVLEDDGDGRATLLIDTPPPGGGDAGVRAVGGRVRTAETGPLAPGNYTVELSVDRGVGDETTLRLRAPAATATAEPSPPATATAEPSPPATAEAADGSTAPSPVSVLLVLLAPAVPVVALVALSRGLARRRRGD